jgi:hypothetical protein
LERIVYELLDGRKIETICDRGIYEITKDVLETLINEINNHMEILENAEEINFKVISKNDI